MVRISVLVAVLAIIGFGSLEAGTGGPDTFGHKFIDSDEPGGPPSSFEDISTTGTVMWSGGDDDNVAGVSMGGMTFNLYGYGYSQVYICTNGFVQFPWGDYEWVNQPFPNPGYPGMVAPFWSDLTTAISGDVRYQAFLSGSSPHFTVQWTNMTFFDGGAEPLTFQVQLYQSGLIVFNYLAMPGSTSGQGTVGINDPQGLDGLMYEFNGSPANRPMHDNLTIWWTFGAAPNRPTGSVQTDVAGGDAQLNGFVSDASIFFRGRVVDPDATRRVGVQVEILPSSQPFGAAMTGQVTTSPLIASGGRPEASYVFAPPLVSGTYHWRIRSFSEFYLYSNWATPANDTFQVDITGPEAPVPTTPLPMADISTTDPAGGSVDFSWTPAADHGEPALNYEIEVSMDGVFTAPYVKATVTTAAFNCYLPVVSTPYYWRVAQRDPFGNLGAFSAPQTFTVSYADPDGHPAGEGKQGCSGSAPSAGGAVAVLLAVLALASTRRRSN